MTTITTGLRARQVVPVEPSHSFSPNFSHLPLLQSGVDAQRSIPDTAVSRQKSCLLSFMTRIPHPWTLAPSSAIHLLHARVLKSERPDVVSLLLKHEEGTNVVVHRPCKATVSHFARRRRSFLTGRGYQTSPPHDFPRPSVCDTQARLTQSFRDHQLNLLQFILLGDPLSLFALRNTALFPTLTLTHRS